MKSELLANNTLPLRQSILNTHKNMKQIAILFLCCLFVVACSDDDKNEEPILVTNVVVTDADKVFKPGETITITAQGFRENDQFIVDVRWPLEEPSGPIKEGYAVSNPIVKEQTPTSITFLVPGHYPAATLKMFLVRGDKKMTLCTVSVADGQAPKELQLYGITNSRSMNGHPRGIQQIDLTTGRTTDIVSFADGEDFTLAVNTPGNYTLCGLLKQGGETSIGKFDLSMRYWKSGASEAPLTFCTGVGSQIFAINQLNEKNLILSSVNTSALSRNNEVPPPTIQIPDGFKPQSLSRYIGVLSSDGYLLLSADNGDGTFSPVTIGVHGRDYNMDVYDPIKTDALIPFWIVAQKEKTDAASGYTIVSGFVLSKPDGSGIELRLWNTTTNSLDEPFAVYPYANKLVSIATHFTEDLKTQEIYMLIEGRENGGLIEIYDLQKKEWRNFPNFGFPYSEILFAR